MTEHFVSAYSGGLDTSDTGDTPDQPLAEGSGRFPGLPRGLDASPDARWAGVDR